MSQVIVLDVNVNGSRSVCFIEKYDDAKKSRT
jgi:hypothetical protein